MIIRKVGMPRIAILLGLLCLLASCSKLPKSHLKLHLKSGAAKPTPTQPSTISVEVSDGGPIVLTTSAAQFELRPDGYVQAWLLKDGKKLSLDDPSVGAPADSDFVRVAGKDVHFTLDFSGSRGTRSDGKDGRREEDRDPGASAGALGDGLAAGAGA